MLRTTSSKPRDAKEFLYHRIDLTPLVEAAKRNDWKKLKSLLDSGYSLLWRDHKSKKSAMKLIKENGNFHLVDKVMDYSEQLHGKYSRAHEFVLLEGANNAFAYAVRESYPSHVGSSTDPNNDNFVMLATTIYYLYLISAHKYRAIDLVKLDNRYSKNHYKLLYAIMRASVTSHDDANITELTDTFLLIQQDNLEIKREVMKVALSVAAEGGLTEWVTKHIKSIKKTKTPGLAEYIGEAIIGAARAGRGKFLFELCELAHEYKVDKEETFMNLLACAAGSALTNEHYLLAKAIMQMVPHFMAKPSDLKEIQKWPQCKIERMCKMMRNHKIFTDIAMHSGLAVGCDSVAWARAMKNEFGLQKISDKGFIYLIQHPEIMAILFKFNPAQDIRSKAYKNTISKDILQSILQVDGEWLSKEDIDAFVTAMLTAKSDVKMNQTRIPFFRIRCLIDETLDVRITPEQEKICLETRNEIIKILKAALSQKLILPESKKLAKRLYSTLLDATSLQMLKKALDNESKTHPKNALLLKCKEVFNKHQAALGSVSGKQVSSKK